MTIDTEPVAEVDRELFATFFAAVEPRLRHILVAAYGSEDGREATAEALAWAWEHRDRLKDIEAPVPYLCRVAKSRARGRRRVRLFAERITWAEPWVEPRLAGALARLSERQRVAVVLVHAFEWTNGEAAEWLGMSPSTVKTHARRGLERLHAALEGENHD